MADTAPRGSVGRQKGSGLMRVFYFTEQAYPDAW